MKSRIRVKSTEMLSKRWGTLTNTTLDYQRADGRWEEQKREIYDHGHAAAIIPYDPARDTVLLVKQFRYTPFSVGDSGVMIEACAGLLDADDPETCIRREAMEEMGVQLRDVELLHFAYASPGSVTEKVALFAGHYVPEDRVAAGGGHEDEGEEIEVLEWPLDDALAAMRDGRIIDMKTIILLQHLELDRLRQHSG